ncbi:RHS repeat-associated core domain-containing protein, partial [uncultured Erwinia sp.]|uniref:RHS repeat-associated core domain-containing protein n=1 Tax=uncultured Erwinia sp. TaxID=246798 RepID=UPI002586EA07
SSPRGVKQNLRFQGQYFDAETGLHYNLFRYYDPVAGRFTQLDPIGLAGGLNTYAYVPDPLTWVDPLGWVPWQKGQFDSWFNNASIQDIVDNKTSVEAALRSPGGKHEMFPVSMASKAKELGFSAQELKAMTVPTNQITFVDVTDKKGNSVPDGPHHGSRAGRHFHNKLIDELSRAETKNEARKIIVSHHSQHMRIKGCMR